MNPHPNIKFRITGYRSISYPERRSDGRYGSHEADHHHFPEGSYDDVKQKFPIGSIHDHSPPAPCRFLREFAKYDPAEERAQLNCPDCFMVPPGGDK